MPVVSKAAIANPMAMTVPRENLQKLMNKYWVGGIVCARGWPSVFEAVSKVNHDDVWIRFIHKTQVERWDVHDGIKMPLECKLQMEMGENCGILKAVEVLDLNHGYALIVKKPKTAVTLEEYLEMNGPMTDAQAKAVFKRLIDILSSVMWDWGVLHGNLNCSKVLVSEYNNEVHLIDFQHSTLFGDGEGSVKVATEEYQPPEGKIEGRATESGNLAWALGVILYQMLHATTPFPKGTNATKKSTVLCSDNVMADCKHLIKMCLEHDPDKRTGIRGIHNHTWLEELKKNPNHGKPSVWIPHYVTDSDC